MSVCDDCIHERNLQEVGRDSDTFIVRILRYYINFIRLKNKIKQTCSTTFDCADPNSAL